MGTSSSKSEPDCDHDSDCEEKVANVYFMLDNSVGVGAHWSVVFDFGSFHITAEGCPAGEFLSKVLKPGYTRTTSEPKGNYMKFTELGSVINFDFLLNLGKLLGSAIFVPNIKQVKISPNQIYKLCLKNKCNDRMYILGVMDCQCWAIEFAYMLRHYEY